MKKVFAMMVVLSATSVVGTSAASAQQQASGCVPQSTASTPYELVYDGIIDMSIYPEDIWDLIVADIAATTDANGDGIVCWRYRTANRGRDKTWSDVAGQPVTDYTATFVTDNRVVRR